MLKGLGPLHAIIEPLQFPKLLQEMQHGRVGVRGVVGVVGAVVVNEGVWFDVWRDNERRNAHTKTSEVICNRAAF